MLDQVQTLEAERRHVVPPAPPGGNSNGPTAQWLARPDRKELCPRCEQVRDIYRDGLCLGCYAPHMRDARDGRLEDYAELRQQGIGIAFAAQRVGVSQRTAERYEATLKRRREEVLR